MDTQGRVEIRRIPISSIQRAEYNARVPLKPGDPEYHRLERSIDEFGLVDLLIWNELTGTLVGGHQRLTVLEARGATEVDVSVVRLSPEREKALNLALNKITGRWDEEKLAELLQDLLATPDLDIELTGFELDEATDLIEDVLGDAVIAPEQFDIEAALRAAGPPVTRPGELVLLGRDPSRHHRLLCGDATDPEAVRTVMNGERAALFATDPPYLVGYDGTGHAGALGGPGQVQAAARAARRGADWDEPAGGRELYEGFVAAAIAEALRADAAWYCWHAHTKQQMLCEVWDRAGALVHQVIVWSKARGVPGRCWYHWRHEPCLFGWLKGHRPPRVTAGRERSVPNLTTVWEIPSIGPGPDRPDHPTPKPLELFEIPMRQHTRTGEVCYEPFAGSGTQVIAAQRLGRRCFAMEISPIYCDLIVRRFIALAGEGAVAPEVAERYRLPGKGEVAA